MARNKVDDCLFCEQRPCRCGDKSTSKRSTRKPGSPRIPITSSAGTDSDPVRPIGSARTTYAEPKVKLPVRIPNTVPSSVLSPMPAWRPALPGETPGQLEPELRSKTQQVRQYRSQEETELRIALTVLADAELLCPEDLERERERIDLPSWRIDALIWRQNG